MSNPRSEIVQLLRGMYAGPSVVQLAELGVLDRLCEGSAAACEFSGIENTQCLASLLRYLVSIELLEERDERFSVTDLGRSVFQRAGSFQIFYSYEPIIKSLDALLQNPTLQPVVNRERNIAGSGSLHLKKFFPAALEMCDDFEYTSAIDLGCGDGTFLDALIRRKGMSSVRCLDLAPEAVAAATSRLESLHPSCAITGVVANAGNVSAWKCKVGMPDVASLWFVVHEFCDGSADSVINFFKALRDAFPTTDILVGEIVSHAPSALADSRANSALPEFLLFHELSGQKPLSWAQWQSVRAAIPYEIQNEYCMDPLANGEPSAFLWHLAASA
ncbi:methyltransferase domain-containing protein [Neorhodopirellula lusitana]|uniref:methyltransferase domain-containing protein n=1 Tax=Neorhodopirellula lusitana TaxID=445327 RepID=UPI0038508893